MTVQQASNQRGPAKNGGGRMGVKAPELIKVALAVLPRAFRNPPKQYAYAFGCVETCMVVEFEVMGKLQRSRGRDVPTCWMAHAVYAQDKRLAGCGELARTDLHGVLLAEVTRQLAWLNVPIRLPISVIWLEG